MKTFDASFLDVATNALAIVVIVTMFALLTVKPETGTVRDPRFAEDEGLKLRTQLQLPERPFHDYYFVFDGRIVRWEQERYVERLIADGLRDAVDLPGGKLRVSAVLEPRDPDSFTASFFPDFSAMRSRGIEITPGTVDALSAQISHRQKERGLAPNFVVYSSGMEAFATLYRKLRNEPIWLRWFLWTEDEPLRIERRVKHFARYEYDF